MGLTTACYNPEKEALFRTLEGALQRILEIEGYAGAGYGEVIITMVAKRVTRLQPNGSIQRQEVSAHN